MIIAGDPRLYSNPVIRQLLDATDKPTTNTGRYDRPRLQLNALNFLWGHQVFANIYHNGNGRNGKYTDRERHGWGQQQQQDNGANGSKWFMVDFFISKGNEAKPRMKQPSDMPTPRFELTWY